MQAAPSVPPQARPVAGGTINVWTPDATSVAAGEDLSYEVWTAPGRTAWVELSADPNAPPLRLDAASVSAIETVLDAHAPQSAIQSVGVGANRDSISMLVRQEWPLLPSVLTSAAFVCALVLGLVARRSRRRAAAVLALARHDAASREAERTRVAREIHDGPLQDLALLALSSGPSTAAARLRDLSADLRALAADLRPPALDRLGLVAAFDDLAERWVTSPQPLTVRVQVALGEGLAADVELALYRIVQEAITNAATHGLARTVWVFLRMLDTPRARRSVSLVVRDDGIGISSSLDASTERKLLAAGHFGLVGMAERARAVGATLSVSRGPGGLGTEIQVRLPMVYRRQTRLRRSQSPIPA